MDTSTRRTDAELIQAYAVSQDDAAFSEVAIRYQQMVHQACLRMLGNAHDAQDATQAVFLVLMKKAAQLTRAGSLSGWLLDVSRKVSLEAIRRRTGTYSQESEAILWHEAMADETPVDYEQAVRILDEELAGLSAKLREAVVLRYLQGNSEKAAAEQAGCPQGTLSRRASDGLARLRQRFARRGMALGGVALVGLLESQARAAVPETLLPSILAAVKQAAATTATATALPGVALGAKTGTTKAVMLAEGVMKAMSIVKVKWVACVIGAAVVLTGVPVLVMTTRADAPKDRTTAVTTSADGTHEAKVESTERIICKKEYRLVSPDGDKEIGIYGILAVQMDEPEKKIHITETISMDYRGKRAEYTSSVIYSGNPRLTPDSGTVETKIDGKVCMKGMVTFSEKTVTFECTGFLDKRTGDAIDPPKRFAKEDQPKPQGVLIFQSALPAIGPRFLPKEGDLKDVIFVWFPEDIGAPELINFGKEHRLVRDKPDENGEYDLKIFSPHSEDSISHMRYNKNDQLVSIASFGKMRLPVVWEEKKK